MTEGHYFETGLGGGWDAALLEPMAELNAEILAAYAGVEASLSAPWRRLGAAARTRLAACPYLLLDAGFARAELWSCWPRAGVHEATATVPQLHGQTMPGTPVLRRCLLFAWHLARANRLGARIALGMSASCAAALASCRIVDLEALAELRPAWIKPRWAEQPEIWQAWIGAAQLESPRALQRLQLWGLQMLAADVARQRVCNN